MSAVCLENKVMTRMRARLPCLGFEATTWMLLLLLLMTFLLFCSLVAFSLLFAFLFTATGGCWDADFLLRADAVRIKAGEFFTDRVGVDPALLLRCWSELTATGSMHFRPLFVLSQLFEVTGEVKDGLEVVLGSGKADGLTAAWTDIIVSLKIVPF